MKVIMPMTSTPARIAPPLSHSDKRPPYHGASWPPGIQFTIGSRPNTSRKPPANRAISVADRRSSRLLRRLDAAEWLSIAISRHPLARVAPRERPSGPPYDCKHPTY